MDLEEIVKDILEADPTVNSLATDRIYTSSTVGRDGLTEDATPNIFDENGDLLPSILVRMRDEVPDYQVYDPNTPTISAVISLEIYFYEERKYVNIDLMRNRTRAILQGRIIESSYEMERTLELPRLRDEAALAGASLARQDWSLSIIQ